MQHIASTTRMIVAGAIALCGAASCSQHAVEPQSSKALFHEFTYAGHDSIYDAVALTEPGQYYNPILPGWYSDPSICVNDSGDYFLVTSTFTYYPGVPIFHSRDLVNWEQVGNVLSRPSQLQNLEKQHVSGGIFAPAIAYNPANKTYYMVTTNVGAGNFFVKTTDPFGEWSDPIMLPEVQGIDPAFFFDEDGRGYIVNNDDAPDGKAEYPGHRTVRVVEFDPATDKCVGERKIVVNKGVRPEDKPIWCEGPHIYKINGEYYLMTAEGGTSDWHSEVIYRGPTPFGPYKPWDGNPILTQRTLDPNRPDPVTCAGHADLVKGPDGNWWGVFLACRPIDGKFENLGRETFMMPVKWTEDGWPYMTREGETVGMVYEVPGAVRGENVTFGNFAVTDAFADSVAGLEWMTLRGPADDYLSFTENPGFLTVSLADVNSGEKAQLPYLGRRIQHHSYDATTRVTFNPEDEEQTAGLLLLKDETHQYLIARGLDADGHCIYVARIGEGGEEQLARAATDATTVDLRISSDGPTVDFAWSTDEGATWNTLLSGADAAYTSTARTGGFTGSTVGPYASAKRH